MKAQSEIKFVSFIEKTPSFFKVILGKKDFDGVFYENKLKRSLTTEISNVVQEDESKRTMDLLRFAQKNFAEKTFDSLIDEYQKIQEDVYLLFHKETNLNSYQKLLRLLNSCDGLSIIVDKLKKFDRDFFLYNELKNAKLPYSKEFEDALLNKKEFLSFEKRRSIFNGLMSCNFEEGIFLDYRSTSITKFQFDFILKNLSEFKYNKKLAFPYSSKMYQLFEKHARYIVQVYISNVQDERDIDKCFKILFDCILDLRKTFFTSIYYNESLITERLVIDDLLTYWNDFERRFPCDIKYEKQGEWNTLLNLLNKPDYHKIEQTWKIFERDDRVSDEVKFFFYQFFFEWLKKVIFIPFLPNKVSFIHAKETLKLLIKIQKKEHLNLRKLFKLILKFTALDFQDQLSKRIVQSAMKCLHQKINEEIQQIGKDIFYMQSICLKMENLRLALASNQKYMGDILLTRNGKTHFLIKSILDNNFDEFKSLIEKSNINLVNKRGETALLILIKLRKFDWISYLLKANANAFVVDFNGQGVLHLLANTNQKDLILYFLNLGLDINLKDLKNRTPFYLAVKSGNIKNIKLFLKKGANVNFPDYLNRSPLLIALKHQNREIIQTMISYGANIFHKDYNLRGLLHYASHYNAKCIFDFDFINSLDFNEKDVFLQTPIFMSFNSLDKEFVSYLINQGADINIQDVKGNSLLHHAVILSNFDMARLLLEKGIALDVQNYEGKTALYMAALYENVKMFKLLLDFNPKTHLVANNNKSVRTLVLKSSNRMLKFYLKENDIRNKYYEKCFVTGVLQSDINLVRFAFKKRIKMDKFMFDDKNVLELAIEIGDTRIIAFLLRHQIARRERIIPNLGLKGTLKAIKERNINDLRIFARSGIDINGMDSSGKALSSYIFDFNNDKILQVFMNEGYVFRFKKHNL